MTLSILGTSRGRRGQGWIVWQYLAAAKPLRALAALSFRPVLSLLYIDSHHLTLSWSNVRISSSNLMVTMVAILSGPRKCCFLWYQDRLVARRCQMLHQAHREVFEQDFRNHQNHQRKCTAFFFHYVSHWFCLCRILTRALSSCHCGV